MENLTQQIERARHYLADIRAGHVSFADEGAPFMTLSGHLAVLLGIIDDQWIAYPLPEGEQARVRDGLLAEVPASQRLPDPEPGDFAWAVATALVRQPGDVAQAVTEWLRAARRESPALDDAQRATLGEALSDAITLRTVRLAARCAKCSGHEQRCAEHTGDLDSAALYRALAQHFGIEVPR
ncbi:MAG: hypothetical protein ACHP9Z_18530 [Streptosporangiales bacterium]